MRTFFSILLTFIASLIVSQFVAQMLAIQFRSREEFIGVMAFLFLFSVLSIVVLTAVYVLRTSAAALGSASLVLAALVIAATVAATIFGMSQSNWAWPGSYDFKLIAEFLLPALLVVAVQWSLLRRRRLRVAS